MPDATTCSFPDCNCPMDPGPDPDWCARSLPKPAPGQRAGYRKQAEEVAASVRQGVLKRAAQILKRSGQERLASEVEEVAAGRTPAPVAGPSGSDWVAAGGFLEYRHADGSTRWNQVSKQYEGDADVVTLYRKRPGGVWPAESEDRHG